nr:autocrine proliferation repressor protein A-like [Lytechinus pictus]
MVDTKLFVVALCCCAAATVVATPLDDYVNMADPHYKYEVLSEHKVHGEYIAYVLNMTSQKWLTYNDSDSAIWWHYLTITIPDNLTHPEYAAIYVTGGSNNGGPPDPLKDAETLFTSLMAVGSGCVSAILRQIPNQPIVFKTDPLQKKRSEDAIIAFTWRHFIENGTDEPYWLLRMPMTKAVVRAMDTLTDHVLKVRGEKVSKFVIAGASKRGWTTWTTGAVDKRVVGIAPMVLDLLNMVKNLHHMYRSLGGWTFAFEDYYTENVTLYLDEPNTQKLADIVDPLAYKDRLTMPKLIITAGSDEFFLPDDSYYYFDLIPEPKFLRITPNGEHSLTLHHVELVTVMTAFMRTITEPTDWTQPKMTWKRYENSTHGIIELTSDPPPFRIEVWRTLTNRGKRRDFRLAVAKTEGSSEIYPHLIIYKNFPARNPSPGKYIAEFLTPETGWQCFFIKAFYYAPGGAIISFTTEANITPSQKFAVPDCHGTECRGTLV